jgi:hypothetical protein
MTLPYQEHNSLLVAREFLITLLNQEKILNDSEKIRLSARAILKHYPTREKLDELYKGNTINDISNNFNNSQEENSNKVLNDNQTWNTPGFNWKTEVEFIQNNESQ